MFEFELHKRAEKVGKYARFCAETQLNVVVGKSDLFYAISSDSSDFGRKIAIFLKVFFGHDYVF